MDPDVVPVNVENKCIGLKTLICEYYYFCCKTVMCYVSEFDVWDSYRIIFSFLLQTGWPLPKINHYYYVSTFSSFCHFVICNYLATIVCVCYCVKMSCRCKSYQNKTITMKHHDKVKYQPTCVDGEKSRLYHSHSQY